MYPGVKIDHLDMAGIKISRYTFDAGWYWPEEIDSCQEEHLIWFVMAGRFGLKMDDGAEVQFEPGDIARIPPGHTVWVIGDEPVEAINIETFTNDSEAHK